MTKISGVAQQPLGVLQDVVLTPAQLRAVLALEGYDLGQIRHRLQVKSILPPTSIDEALLEFRRFLSLQILSETPVSVFSQAVDEVWHTCIMFTRRYTELNEQAFGRFMHHRPDAGHEYAMLDAPPDARARFAVFRATYERYYGPLPRLWLVDRPWAEDMDLAPRSTEAPTGGSGWAGT